MNTLTLSDLPLPPSLNNAYRNLPGVGRVASDDLRHYKAAAVPLATFLAREAEFQVPPKARLRIALTFAFATRTSHTQSDIDNRVKPMLDALSAALHFNDNRVDELIVRRAPYTGRAGATALVEILEER
jgi:Holliday junction resolvase RusA-like endonuclease